MKKVYITVILIVLITFCGYLVYKSTAPHLTPSEINVNNENIEATLSKNSISSSQHSMALVLKNKTNKIWVYGYNFTLEVEKENVWYQVPFKENASFSDLGMYLEGNSQTSYVIKLPDYFPALEEGKYRIVQSMYNSDNEHNYVTAPFEIKE